MRRLPLFPLPVVLFPGAPMPLHIFEPRYRRMVAFCLEHDRRFGLVYHDPDRQGPFLMERDRVGCVAEIVQFEPLPDGRSVLLTRGERRFRLEDGIESGSLYHEGLVDEYEDEDSDTWPARRRESVDLFQRALEHLSGSADVMPNVDEDQDISFHLARWIRVDPVWQQELLESRSERDRLERIDRLLRATLTI